MKVYLDDERPTPEGIRQIEKRIREESHMWDGKKPDLDFVFGSR